MSTLGSIITTNSGLGDNQKVRLKEIKYKYEDLINLIDEKLINGCEKNLVITKLQEALMWTTRSIAIEPTTPFKSDVEWLTTDP